MNMQMERLNIRLPKHLKAKLDALRTQGTTASGLIRYVLEEHFNQAPLMSRKGR